MSPLIVRTIEVPDAVTLAVLHEAMLVLFGWSSEHLHEFTIRAVGYSTDWVVDAEDSRRVTLDSLGLRVGERFCWAYDFSLAGSSISGLKPSRPSLGRGSRACPAGGLGRQNGVTVMTVFGRGRTLIACRSTPSA